MNRDNGEGPMNHPPPSVQLEIPDEELFNRPVRFYRPPQHFGNLIGSEWVYLKTSASHDIVSAVYGRSHEWVDWLETIRREN